jgi:hypothetical protein
VTVRPRRLTALLIATVALFEPVSSLRAQSVLEVLAGIKFCKTLKDDAQRLKCFDGLFTEKLGKAVPEDEPASTGWSIKQNKSPVDDSPQISASLTVKEVALTLRCREKQTDALFGGPFTFFGSSKAIKVLVRINEGKPVETNWSPSTSGTAVFAPSAIQLIRALPENGKLFIRAVKFDGSPVDGEFSLGNVSQVRDQIATACHWP